VHTHELEALKKTYIDNVAVDIVTSLEHSLSWAKEENRGLGYWLERSAVKTAAKELLNAVHLVKQAGNTALRQDAIKLLYRGLIKHQAQLKDLWIFSFGHQNTRDLINKTLKTIDGLSTMGNDQLDKAFIQEIREEAHANLLNEQFNNTLKQIEEKNGTLLKNHPQWIGLKKKIYAIQLNNESLYALDELYYLLSQTMKKLTQNQDNLRQPISELSGELRTIYNKFYKDNKELIGKTKYFDYRADSLEKKLRSLANSNLGSATIKPCRNGFNGYFDLIIEGSSSSALFDNFTRYNSQSTVLGKKRAALACQLTQKKTSLGILHCLQKELIPPLQANNFTNIVSELIPEACREDVNKLIELNEILAGKLPEDLNTFSQKMKDNLLDRHLTHTFKINQLNLELIEQLNDQELKADFLNLYNRINQLAPEKPVSWIPAILGFFLNPGSVQETSEDLSYHFDELITRSDSRLKIILQQLINEQANKLTATSTVESNKTIKDIKLLEEQIQFLDHKIKVEEDKTGFMIKRFENLNDLHEFELELSASKSLQPELATSTTPLATFFKNQKTRNHIDIIDFEEDRSFNLSGV
jgi:hypothetical protein